MQPSRNPIGIGLDRFGSGAARLYTRLLDGALAAPLVVVTISLLFAGGSMLAYSLLPQELSPQEDRGFVPIFVSAPQGATVTYTETQMRMVEAAAQPLIESGEATAIFSIVRGGGGGFMFLTLASWDERIRDQAEITAELNRRLQRIPGVRVFARTPNSLGIRGGGQGLRFAVAGIDYDQIALAADDLIAAMEQDPVFDGIRLDYDTTQPQLALKIDRERAADLGVPLESIGQVVQTLLSGRDLGDYFIGDQAVEMRAQAPDGMIQDAAGLDSIQVRTGSGQMVPLSALVTFEESAVAPSLPRQDQRRAIPISATLGEGVDLRTAMRHADALAEQYLPAGMSVLYTGEAKELDQASGGVVRTFAFALIIVLLVLAAQFESFNSAFILMFTVPFGIASAIFAMLLTGGSINIYSQIGLVMLVGIMAKNGILIVEFANQLRDHGQSVNEAIRNAATIRLRPVVMTMVSTVLGGLPLILRSGAGSEAREALGWIIVGGLGFAAIATLFLTPVAYSLLARFTKPRIAEQQRLSEELAAAAGVPSPPMVEATSNAVAMTAATRNRQAAE